MPRQNVPAPRPNNTRRLKSQTDQCDPEVAAFLANGRVRAALKRLKHLGRAANADDVVMVITAVSQSDKFAESRAMIGHVLNVAADSDRLDPRHRAALRTTLAAHTFEHAAIADRRFKTPD